MGFSTQEYWRGLPFPPPGDLPDPHLLCFLHCRWILYHWAIRENFLSEFAQIHVSIWCCLTVSSSAASFSFCLQSFPANKLALHIRWPKYWSFSFSNRPSNEYSGLIQGWIFRLTIDWQYNLNILFYVMIRVSLKRHVFWNQCYNLFCFYVKKRESNNVGIVGK